MDKFWKDNIAFRVWLNQWFPFRNSFQGRTESGFVWLFIFFHLVCATDFGECDLWDQHADSRSTLVKK